MIQNKFELFLIELKNDKKFDVFEFRMRFNKKWLLYRENNCDAVENELCNLIDSYRMFKKLNQ